MAIAYVVVVLLEYGAVRLFSLLWPETTHGASVLRLVVEFPGIVVIALVAAQLRQSATQAGRHSEVPGVESRRPDR